MPLVGCLFNGSYFASAARRWLSSDRLPALYRIWYHQRFPDHPCFVLPPNDSMRTHREAEHTSLPRTTSVRQTGLVARLRCWLITF